MNPHEQAMAECPLMGEPHSDLGGSSAAEFDELFNAIPEEQVAEARDQHALASSAAERGGQAWILTGDGWLVRYERKGNAIQRTSPERLNRAQRRARGLPSLDKAWPPLAAFERVWAA